MAATAQHAAAAARDHRRQERSASHDSARLPQVGGRLYVVASSGGRPTHPGWYFNLRAHPQVTVEVGEERFPATATVLEGAERDRVFAAIVEQSPDAGRHQAKAGRTIPVIALDPRLGLRS